MRAASAIIVALLLTASLISTDAWSFPHANVESKDTLDAYSGRNYQEGTSAILSLSLGHGCTHSGESFTTRYVTALFPNGANPNLSGVAYTTDGVTNYSGNALFGVKPEVDYNWRARGRQRAAQGPPTARFGQTAAAGAGRPAPALTRN